MTLEYNRLMMSNSCNPTPTLSNTAEIVESKLSFKFTPLQWNRINPILSSIVSRHLASPSRKSEVLEISISV